MALSPPSRALPRVLAALRLGAILAALALFAQPGGARAEDAPAPDAALPAPDAALPALTDDTLPALRDAILPAAREERWREIPWRASAWAAVTEAARRDKPVLLWAMNGHPLACT